MKLKYVVVGLLVIMLLGSAAVAAKNNDSDSEGDDSCPEDMNHELCPAEMMESGQCDEMMEDGQCQNMMDGGDENMMDCHVQDIEDDDEDGELPEDSDPSGHMENGGCDMMSGTMMSGYTSTNMMQMML